MGSFIKPDKPKIKVPPPPPPLPDTKVEEAARKEAEERRRKRAGVAGTILTSPQGVAEEPTILSKKLLGA